MSNKKYSRKDPIRLKNQVAEWIQSMGYPIVPSNILKARKYKNYLIVRIEETGWWAYTEDGEFDIYDLNNGFGEIEFSIKAKTLKSAVEILKGRSK